MSRKGPVPRLPLSIVALCLALALAPARSAGAPLPGGTLDPLAIPKYVTPLVIPPVMPSAAPDNYAIALRQFRQQVLPAADPARGIAGFPTTTVWSYGSAADVAPAVAPSAGSSFHYPAFTIETTSGKPVAVRWINDLKDPVTGNYLPHLLPVDRTLHWANPPAAGCADNTNRTDCSTGNPAPYTGPVPMVVHVHGAHVDPHSDGYPESWWLPAAADIPPSYARRGRLFDDASGNNPGHLGYADYLYRNDQPAATLWYHDHTLGLTRTNVYAGPAGFWLVRGGANDGGRDGVTGLPATLPGPAPAPGDALVALNTPGNPVRNAIREIPLAIQDRSFNADGSLFYPGSRLFFDGYAGPYTGSLPVSTDIAPTWNPEAFFNTIVVNGRTWPALEVAPALYRFRLLNGCNSRFLNLALFEVVRDPSLGTKQKGNARLGREFPFYQIGADQGFLPRVVMIRTGIAAELPGDGTIPANPATAADPARALLLGPAERADVIVDFRGLPAGTVIRMINTGPDAPFGGFPAAPQADPSTTGQVMEFVVDGTLLAASDASVTPPWNLALNAEAPAGPATTSRQVSLNEEHSGQVCVKVSAAGRIRLLQVLPPPPLDPAAALAHCAALGGVPMAPKAARLGTVNLADPAMPVGVPLAWHDTSAGATMVAVRNGAGDNVMVHVTETPRLGDTEEWDIHNFTVDAHPIHLHLVRFEVVGRSPIPGVLPAPVPVAVQPGEKGYKDTVIAYPGEVTRVRARFDVPGLYVWHCHIVEHEDNEMMRPYHVDASAAPAMP